MAQELRGRVSDPSQPLRAAHNLKPPALPGDTYLLLDSLRRIREKVFGRARRGFVTGAPGATRLAAIGPIGRFAPRDMDLAFAEAVSAAAYARGMIACR